MKIRSHIAGKAAEHLRAENDKLKAELKAVRGMRDRLLDEVKKYYFDRNFPVNPSGGLIKDAEAQRASEQKGGEK